MKRVLVLGVVFAVLLGIFVLRGYVRGRTVATAFREHTPNELFIADIAGIRYDPIPGTLVISRGDLKYEDADFNFGITENDLYYRLEYEFTIPIRDGAKFAEAERMPITNWYIDRLSIALEPGFLKLTAHNRRITAFIITSDDRNLHIRPVHPRERYPKILLLDPGHGGYDSGAISARGVIEWEYGNRIEEKDFNLELTRKVEALFADSDIKVYLTRFDDEFVSLPERRRKRDDLADIFVSIHANASDYRARHGILTYYSENAEPLNYTSKDFSLDMLNSMATATEYAVREHDLVFDNSLAVIRSSKIPASLVEAGFLSNRNDLIKLASPDYRELLAQGIYNGIVEGFRRTER